MLQKYDSLKSSLLLALAAAGSAAFSGTAIAEGTVCNLEDGFSVELAFYIEEAKACVNGAESLDAGTADDLVAEINAERSAAGLAPLERRASLDMAAAAHALDMSARNFAAHADLEGRDHLHRIRAFDRTMLVGASGANISVALSSADAAAIHDEIKRDQLNQDNILRASFTDIGIGVVEQAGQVYVVQVFATAEGDLDKALPISATGTQSLSASLMSRDQHVVAWGLSDTESGEMLARSTMPRVSYTTLRTADAADLDVLVAVRDRTYVLKGPLVSGQ